MSERIPLAVRGLAHRHGETPTFGGVDLSVAPGEIVSVLGPSGSGKTTLLRAIAGFATPSAGSIRINGVAVFSDGLDRVPPERRRVGMVFQDYALFPHLTVRGNIEFGIHREPDRERRVGELLTLIGMRDFAARRPAELSGGQQQRVALARAIAPRPALLLLDEPFANLDPARRSVLIEELIGVLDAEGTSTLFVTHNRLEALAISGTVAVFGLAGAGGRLLQKASPEEVYRRPADEEVARITGEAQFVEGRADGSLADTPLGRVRLSGDFHGPVRVLLRPETLRWKPGHGEPAAVVSGCRFVGPGHRLRCRTAAGEFRVECPGDPVPAVGARGALSVEGPCWAFPIDPR